ncbi:MAG: hypothetical protein HY472_00070 [Candidatus Sungbacteria bacterium]|nr:hypothetical protein [Candidatus Sungbacteria bacterium]
MEFGFFEVDTPICQNCANSFAVFPEDLEFYQRIKVPPPTFCPDCRMIRRFLWWNDWHLFRRRDEASGKEIFSGIPPQAPIKTYNRNYWWSDAWEPMAHGRDYDFSRPFFEQMHDLMQVVPWPSRDVVNIVNAEYCNDVAGAKNCYLCFNAGNVENSAYLNDAGETKNSFDIVDVGDSELCYECVGLDKCYRAFFSNFCEECRDIWFCRDCSGCSNCFGCVNLRNKEYHIFNAPHSKEEYFKKLEELGLGSFSAVNGIKGRAEKFWIGFPVEWMHNWHNTDVSGELISTSKRAHVSYAALNAEAVKYSQFLLGVRDSHDTTVSFEGVELLYETLICGEKSNSVKFSYNCWPADSNLEYSMFCGSSSDLFGCIGLRKKQYCILNKQYGREEYFGLREKIIRHMSEAPYVSQLPTPNSQLRTITYRYGEFFPPEFSPFAYQDTVAHDFFPLSREEACTRDSAVPPRETTINADDLPDRIEDVSDSLVGDIIRCSSCGLPYRVIAMELAFYRKAPLPVPRLCPTCRLYARFKFRNPPRYGHRACSCAGRQSDNRAYANIAEHFHGWDNHCPEEFDTSYAPDRPEIVYCQRCYNTEAVG